MKYYTFYRESNNFNDIITDPGVKKHIDLKISWHRHLILGFKYDIEDSVLGYIVLKYGDDMMPLVNKDYTPKPNIDYKPIKS